MSWRQRLRRDWWDAERASELESHLEHATEDLVGRGLDPAAARREALRRLGNPARLREEIYEQNSIPVLDSLARDLRLAARRLRRYPGFALTVIATLALGIGSTTAVFTVVDATLLSPLPYPDADRLGLVVRTSSDAGKTARATSQDGRTWESIRDNVEGIDAAPYSGWTSGVNLVARGAARRVQQQRVGAGYFAVLGIAPALGREFLAEEDLPGGPARVLLSDALWRELFDADPALVGSDVLLRGEPYTVVGVLPPGFDGDGDPDLWTPLRPSRAGEGSGTNYSIVVRPRPGVSWRQAETRIDSALRTANATAPGEGSTAQVRYGLWSLAEANRESSRAPLFVLAVAVGLVLLVACVNVSGLLLSRAHGRAREIATRCAIGGGRNAVIRQLLIESLVLALCGGLVGAAVGAIGLAGLRQTAASLLAIPATAALDLRALAVTAAITLAATLLFGLAPALAAGRTDLAAALAGGGRSVAGGARHPLRRTLVVAQLALATALLVAAALVLRSYEHLSGLPPGFDPEGLLTARASLSDSRYVGGEDTERLFARTLDLIRAAPGVTSATVALGLPYERLLNMPFRVPGEDSENLKITNLTYVDTDYFSTLRMPLLGGRVIEARDRRASELVVVVNESLARTYFGSGPAALDRVIDLADAPRRIIGVVGDTQQRPGWGNFGPLAALPLAYVPLAQLEGGFFEIVHTWFSPAWIVRTAGNGPAVERAIQEAITTIDPQLPIYDLRPLSEMRARVGAPQRALVALIGGLGTLALLLAGVGAAGLVASEIAERRRELGIRMALGATHVATVSRVALPAIRLALLGVALGTGLALAFGDLLRSWLWGVTAHDPMTLARVAATLVLVVAAASVIASLRVLTVDPAHVLRVE